jgi:4-carboxymuconolactone decarboxylase
VRDDTSVLVRMSAALACGDTVTLRSVMSEAVRTAEAIQVEEALLQSYLFLGYPAALRGLAEWRRVGGGRGVVEPETPDWNAWASRGEETCARIYGGQYPRLRDNIASLHPDMEQWMVIEGYGKVLSRPGLDLVMRELCIVALLAPQDAAPQLYSHLRGALNAGAAESDVDEAVALILPMLGAAHRDQLHEQWSAVRSRRAREFAKD